ncbi:hypothetical protein GCM10009731_27450 [Streptomyces globosus]
METAGVDPDISYELSVALSEACANAVEHGGPAPAAEPCGDYRVTAYLDGDCCRIEVTDSGPGFPEPGPAALTRRARAAASDPVGAGADTTREAGRGAAGEGGAGESGRGLWLIEELADHVRFRNRPGRGAVVSFDKILKWRDGAALLQVS